MRCRDIFRALALVTTLSRVSFALADCTLTPGDLAPGTRDESVSPPWFHPTGNASVDVGDVVILLRGAVELDVIEWLDPAAGCPVVPGDLAPGTLDETTIPPTWTVLGDGLVTVGDVVALLRVAVGLQRLDDGRPLRPAIAALGATSVSPFSRLEITGSGFDPEATTTVRFAGPSGFVADVPPVLVTPGRILVGAPTLVDDATGLVTTGMATVEVRQSTPDGDAASNVVAGLSILSLPTTAAAPGSAVLGVLLAAEDMASSALADLPGTDLDSPELQQALAATRDDLATVRARVRAVWDGAATTVDLGTFAGEAIRADAEQLLVADRMILATLDALGSSAPLTYPRRDGTIVLASSDDCAAANARVLRQDFSTAGIEAIISSGQTPGQQQLQAIVACTPQAVATSLSVVGASAGIGSSLVTRLGAAELAEARARAVLTYVGMQAWTGLLAIGGALRHVDDTAAVQYLQTSVEEIDRQVQELVAYLLLPDADDELYELIVDTTTLVVAFSQPIPPPPPPPPGPSATFTADEEFDGSCFYGTIAVSFTGAMPGGAATASASWGSSGGATIDAAGRATIVLDLPTHCPCLSGTVSAYLDGALLASDTDSCW
jgi:hypothetical protein